jgi:hypothetical protein
MFQTILKGASDRNYSGLRLRATAQRSVPPAVAGGCCRRYPPAPAGGPDLPPLAPVPFMC